MPSHYPLSQCARSVDGAVDGFLQEYGEVIPDTGERRLNLEKFCRLHQVLQYTKGAADAHAENSLYEDLSVSFTEGGVCMVSVPADELAALRAFREHYWHLPEPPELLAEAGFGYDPEEDDLEQDPEAQIAALEVGLAFQTAFKEEVVSQLRERLEHEILATVHDYFKCISCLDSNTPMRSSSKVLD